jgi:hypothetical protein
VNRGDVWVTQTGTALTLQEGGRVNELDRLITVVEDARRSYLDLLAGISPEQALFRTDPESWSIAQITEHLVHAEMGGINLIWRAADGVARGAPVWNGESPNRGLNIEEVVQRTWQTRETAPDSAQPRMGGPFAYWAAALRSCAGLLLELKVVLLGLPLEDVVYPHVISGPLDARQRLQFLAFHLDRHRHQAAAVMSSACDVSIPIAGTRQKGMTAKQ